MFLTLPESGLKVKLWVEFTKHERRNGTHRDTTVKVLAMRDAGETKEEIEISSGMSSCSPLDNFSRLMGRRLACNDLFTKMEMKQFSKRDRAAIFDAICPTYRKRREGVVGVVSK